MEKPLKFEAFVPVFLGALCSLILSAILSVKGPGLVGCFADEVLELVEEEIAREKADVFFTELPEEEIDLIHTMYREPDTQEWVIDFFSDVCGSRETAEIILAGASASDIRPALAFALSWEESRFNPKAVNLSNQNGSIDRGLFQLNNRSFPDLDIDAFFDIEINTQNAMSHLRYCLNTGGTEVAALAMYNAGSGRVKTTGAPKSTLDYINRILNNSQKLESRFQDRALEFAERHEAEAALLAEAEESSRSYFIPLSFQAFSGSWLSASGK